MLALVIIGFTCLTVVAPGLALHHLLIHYEQPPPDGIPELCLLQPKDVCASHCTHETWVVAALVLGVVLIACGALY